MRFHRNQILDQIYQIIREIDQGGAGVIYLAYHLRLEKYVVIKQISSSNGPMPSRIEVDTLKGLRHSNLPQVHDFLKMGDYVYTVMDYIEGTNLQKYLDSHTVFSIENLIHWFRQLTEVLVYLNKQEIPIIHGDIKPANVIITPQNDAILIDFNVALSNNKDTVLGLSYNYASPEQMNLAQMRGKTVKASDYLDTRSDIYSLCAMFYHLISKKYPSLFYGTTPLIQMQVACPETLARIIDKGMELDREKRYPTPKAMLKDISEIWKKEKSYKLYLLGQVTVILGSAFLISAGLYQSITGYKTAKKNEYKAAYNQCVQMINRNLGMETEAICLNFMNRFDHILEDRPEDKAAVLKGLGDVSLENYSLLTAADYYLKAAESFSKSDVVSEELMLDCYYGAVYAYIESNNYEDASSVAYDAKLAGVDDVKIELLNIQIDCMTGHSEDGITMANQVLQTTGDQGVCSRACLAVAEGKVDSNTIEWLEKGYQYTIQLSDYESEKNGKHHLLRRVGSGFLEIYQQKEISVDVKNKALKNAVECYQSLVKNDNASINDYLNLATAMRLLGNYDEAVAVLNLLEASDIHGINQGIVSMNKAFAFYEKGDTVRAMEQIRKSLDQLTINDVSQEEWNKLNEIGHQYGL